MRVILVSPFSPFREHDHAASDMLVGLVKHLAPRIELYVYSPDARWSEESVRALAAGCELLECRALPRAGVRARIGAKPYWQRSAWTREMSNEVRAYIERINPDVVHGEYLQSAEALDGFPRSVLRLHDDTTDLMRRALSRSGKLHWPYRFAEYSRTRSFERHAVRSVTVPIAISKLDLEVFREMNQATRYMPPSFDLSSKEWRSPPLSQPADFLFIGAMWREANARAAIFLGRQVMPLVWRDYPNARLRIVGAGPGAHVVRLEGDPRIRVLGRVESFDAEILKTSAVFAPTIYGGGVLMKVLKPMALGCPVITSPEVLTAIGAYNGEGISVTNANEFAEAAGSVLEDPASAARVGIRGRQLVQSRFTWETGITALFSAYEVAVSA